MKKKINTIKAVKMEEGLYAIRVETDIFLDEKTVVVKYFNTPKGGDKWYSDIFIATKNK